MGFLPLNTRDDFNVLYKFFSREEFTDDYLDEEMELTQRYLEPPDAETIRRMMLERAPRGDVRRAADYFKLIRYSFSGGAKSFAGKSCDIRRFLPSGLGVLPQAGRGRHREQGLRRPHPSI